MKWSRSLNHFCLILNRTESRHYIRIHFFKLKKKKKKSNLSFKNNYFSKYFFISYITINVCIYVKKICLIVSFDEKLYQKSFDYASKTVARFVLIIVCSHKTVVSGYRNRMQFSNSMNSCHIS